MSDTSTEYEAWLLERVIGSVCRGATTLQEVVAAAAGADPAIVRDALNLAVTSGRLEPTVVAQVKARGDRESDRVIEPSLPPTHPLDFEWRFSLHGAEHLLTKVAEQGGGDLCFIASTTVALLAASREWQSRIVAVDSNRLILESARRLQPRIDIAPMDVTTDVLPEVSAIAVVTDPPWYPEFVPGFLWASARLCVHGGCVLLSLPGEGTRPTVVAERADVLRTAALYGLEVVAIEEQALTYETPLFECNALRAAGIAPRVGFWRKGDLVIFRRTGSVKCARPAPPPGDGVWTEVSAHGTRIRFRRALWQNSCSPRLQPIVPGDILPTVSRRDPRRAKADVWTSGNRVFACESPDILRVIVEAVAQVSPAVAAVEAFLGRELQPAEEQSVSEALEQVTALIGKEREEQAAYAQEISDPGSCTT